MKSKRFFLPLVILLVTAACSPSSSAPQPAVAPVVSTDTAAAPIPSPTLTFTLPPPTRTASPAPSLTPLPSSTGTMTAIPTQSAVGPEAFPEGYNPLTGLPALDPASLLLPPALVSITNSPIGARPQAGLSFSPLVFEMYIGEGTTRFLALFYGDFPAEAGADSTRVGPIRSGRLPYESLRKIFNGFLVFASASKYVLPRLNDYSIVYGTDDVDVNDAFITVEKLKQIGSAQQKSFNPQSLFGQAYDPNPPPDGLPATRLWIPYNYRGQVFWNYDSASGAYLRTADQIDATTFVQATDRLNGQPLTFENVIVLFADITFFDQTLFDIQLIGIKENPALLLRDGQIYNIRWTTYTDSFSRRTGFMRRMRFSDPQGNPIPLKPGQTWVEIVPRGTPLYETIDTMDYWQLMNRREPGSGSWVVQFSAPKIDLDE